MSGKTVQLMRDNSLPLLGSIQMARHEAQLHMLRYKPTNEPLDYLIAYQPGFVLPLFENEPERRFDFTPAQDTGLHVEPLMAAGLNLSEDDRKVLPEFAKSVAQWALMNLRSLPAVMRIDLWIATEYPELKELQNSGLTTPPP